MPPRKRRKATSLRKYTVRGGVIALALGLLYAVAPFSDAAIPLGGVVSPNPADFTPDVQDGAVHKFVQAGDVMYAGGQFSSVREVGGGAEQRRNLVAFDAHTGRLGTFAPKIDGTVWGLATDGTSLFVGGEFARADGMPRRGLVKYDLASGRMDYGFNAKLDGDVHELAFVNGRLIAGGSFTGALRALDPGSGDDTGYLNVGVSGKLTPTSGAVEVYRFAVDPAARRLVAIGNFTTVGGAAHPRAVMLDLTPNAATVNPWGYGPLAQQCVSPTLVAYLRDVDFAPDGSYFVLVSTGSVPLRGQVGSALCDAAARFETNQPSPKKPTWISYTGGDTLHSVAVTDKGVYVQGHQRWMDNPKGRDAAGAGAVSRPGIAALDPRTGRSLAWNPTKGLSIGGKDLYVTDQGLWVGSDTERIGNETHKRIALLPRA